MTVNDSNYSFSEILKYYDFDMYSIPKLQKMNYRILMNSVNIILNSNLILYLKMYLHEKVS